MHFLHLASLGGHGGTDAAAELVEEELPLIFLDGIASGVAVKWHRRSGLPWI
jgi:hypothetical protein